jgi:hypothetical protein
VGQLKIHVFLFSDALQVHVVKNVALGRRSNSLRGLRPWHMNTSVSIHVVLCVFANGRVSIWFSTRVGNLIFLPISYLICTRSFFTRNNEAGRASWPLPPLCGEAKNVWSFILVFHIPYVGWCLGTGTSLTVLRFLVSDDWRNQHRYCYQHAIPFTSL